MNFSSQSFLQNRNERILLYYYETSGGLVFVCFLEEIEGTKKTFWDELTFSTYLPMYTYFRHSSFIQVQFHLKLKV